MLDPLRHQLRAKRWTPERATGAHGEDLAMRYLQRHGYIIAARNYRPRSGSGEVDLVAWEGNVLAFVEVKTRSDTESGTPDRAVHAQKQQTLARVAREYLFRVKTPCERVRFDVVTVVETRPPEITLFRDAFEPFY